MSQGKTEYKQPHKFYTMENFEKYLELHKEDTFVPLSARSCPIAGFLRENLGDGFIGVSRARYGVYKDKDHENPKWARKFIEQVDRNFQIVLLGQEALELLRRIKDAMQGKRI